MLKDMGRKHTEAEIKAMIAKADVDGDGKITYAEFLAMFESK